VKRRIITLLVCLAAAITPAILIILGVSGRGLLPDSLELYSESASVSTPSGDTLTYSAASDEYAVISRAILTAEGSSRESAEAASSEYVRFDLTLKGERSLTVSAYLSYTEPCGYLATVGDKYYKMTDEATYAMLESTFCACLWVGEAPPAVTLGDMTLEVSLVEWTYVLPSGTEVSSGEYIAREPKKYTVTSHADIAPSLERRPDVISIVAMTSDGTRIFEGDAEELAAASLPSDVCISVIYSVEWRMGARECVRAAYAFEIPAKAEKEDGRT